MLLIKNLKFEDIKGVISIAVNRRMQYNGKKTTGLGQTIIIGYYTVLCTTWKYIVLVRIVLKTCIGLDPIQVFNTIRTSTIYFHIVHNTV